MRRLIIISLFFVLLISCSNPFRQPEATATNTAFIPTIPAYPLKTSTGTPTSDMTSTPALLSTPDLRQNSRITSSFTLMPTLTYTPTQTILPKGTPSTWEDKPELRSLG